MEGRREGNVYMSKWWWLREEEHSKTDSYLPGSNNVCLPSWAPLCSPVMCSASWKEDGGEKEGRRRKNSVEAEKGVRPKLIPNLILWPVCVLCVCMACVFCDFPTSVTA